MVNTRLKLLELETHLNSTSLKLLELAIKKGKRINITYMGTTGTLTSESDTVGDSRKYTNNANENYEKEQKDDEDKNEEEYKDNIDEDKDDKNLDKGDEDNDENDDD